MPPGQNGACPVSSVGSAVWCLVFALVVLAVLMLDEFIVKLERRQNRR